MLPLQNEAYTKGKRKPFFMIRYLSDFNEILFTGLNALISTQVFFFLSPGI